MQPKTLQESIEIQLELSENEWITERTLCMDRLLEAQARIKHDREKHPSEKFRLVKVVVTSLE